MFGDYQGAWGVVRLLEQAQVTAIDSRGTQSKLVLATLDDLSLTWHIRSRTPNGPLALLRLRGFQMPTTVFQANAAVPSNAFTEDSLRRRFQAVQHSPWTGGGPKLVRGRWHQGESLPGN